MRVLIDGILFGEQPRWHEDRLWFSDWGTRELITVDLEGNREVVLEGPSFPMCAGWLPDGRLLLISAREGLLLRREPDGTMATHADLSAASDPPAGNELVVDAGGNAYVNGGGFDLMAREDFAPGVITMVSPDGSVRQVADGLAFPNGMHLSADGSTLIVAESYAKRLTAFEFDDEGGLTNRRVWAELGDGVPDGICLDSENAVWYSDVPNQSCVASRRGECCRRSRSIEVARLASGSLTERRCSWCVRNGAARRACSSEPRTGQVLTTRPRAGRRMAA